MFWDGSLSFYFAYNFSSYPLEGKDSLQIETLKLCGNTLVRLWQLRGIN